MTVKQIAKAVFFTFLSACLCFGILHVLDIIGGDKYVYYVGGMGYACLHFLARALTEEWRSK
jgi:hypothetical protein